MLDKLKVKRLYLAGYSQNEIAKILNCKVDTIKKCIQRNFKDLKNKHKVAYNYKKETLKSSDKEVNSYISSRDFVKRNMSIYNTKANGDIKINKKVAPTTTWDTPKKLSHERDLTK